MKYTIIGTVIGCAVGISIALFLTHKTEINTTQETTYATTTVTVLQDKDKCENEGGQFTVSPNFYTENEGDGYDNYTDYSKIISMEFNCTVAPKQLWDFSVATGE